MLIDVFLLCDDAVEQRSLNQDGRNIGDNRSVGGVRESSQELVINLFQHAWQLIDW